LRSSSARTLEVMIARFKSCSKPIASTVSTSFSVRAGER
jgi:hypothetical protein